MPSGVLGLGFDRDALARGVAARPDIICIDGGSTDSGPYSLGTGTSKYSRAACKAEWRDLMQARATLGVPLIISTCGTCGTDSMVEWMYDITKEIAEETNEQVKVACLFSEMDAANLQSIIEQQRCHALDPRIELNSDIVESCTHIVALAGAEQIQSAIDTGADIVLAGRATDTAAISALPLRRGDHAGGAWHGAKIAECGALCSTNPTSGVILVDFDESGFSVEPMASDAVCTPHSVSAHMLYENTDPHRLREPGGTLDVSKARYTQQDRGRVRVEGSVWETNPYTVKLEAARLAGYQCTLLALLRSQRYTSNAQAWIDRLHAFLTDEIQSSMQLDSSDYSLQFRLIGMNATLGDLENRASQPSEIGVLCIVTADTEERALELSKLVNPYLLHYPLEDNEPLPTFAFPHSPAHSNRGAMYEFCMNHIIDLNDPMDVFHIDVRQAG